MSPGLRRTRLEISQGVVPISLGDQEIVSSLLYRSTDYEVDQRRQLYYLIEKRAGYRAGKCCWQESWEYT